MKEHPKLSKLQSLVVKCCKLYNILQPNCAILLSLGCSFKTIENMALRSWQIFCNFVLSVRNEYPRVSTGYYFPPVIQMYTKFANLQGYIFYSLQHFKTKHCNFAKFRMLFQAVVIFFPISIFFQNFV